MVYGCCSGSGSCGTGRNFMTKDEKIQMLEDYKKELENEVQGVSERIKDLKQAK